MKENFEQALAGVLAHEGGYTHHPSDPGGPTNWGITIADARRYWRRGASAADVRAMPLSVAKSIYRAQYWNALRCDELPAGVDYAVFDYGVNSGVGRARRVLRAMLKRPVSSAALTESDIAAARNADAGELVIAICAERRAFLRRLKTWPVFGRGWSRRVADVERAALAMADAKPRAALPSARGAPAKATVPPASPSGKIAAGAATGAGVAGVGMAGLGGSTLLLIAGGLCIAAVAGWMIWRWRERQRVNRIATMSGPEEGITHGLV